MIALTEVKTIKRDVIYGAFLEDFQERDFQLEGSDVGRILDHFQGFNSRSYKITQLNVGRKIRIISQSNGYCCWYFIP